MTSVRRQQSDDNTIISQKRTDTGRSEVMLKARLWCSGYAQPKADESSLKNNGMLTIEPDRSMRTVVARHCVRWRGLCDSPLTRWYDLVRPSFGVTCTCGGGWVPQSGWYGGVSGILPTAGVGLGPHGVKRPVGIVWAHRHMPGTEYHTLRLDDAPPPSWTLAEYIRGKMVSSDVGAATTRWWA